MYDALKWHSEADNEHQLFKHRRGATGLTNILQNIQQESQEVVRVLHDVSKSFQVHEADSDCSEAFHLLRHHQHEQNFFP